MQNSSSKGQKCVFWSNSFSKWYCRLLFINLASHHPPASPTPSLAPLSPTYSPFSILHPEKNVPWHKIKKWTQKFWMHFIMQKFRYFKIFCFVLVFTISGKEGKLGTGEKTWITICIIELKNTFYGFPGCCIEARHGKCVCFCPLSCPQQN